MDDCRKQAYSEEYLDYLAEYFVEELMGEIRKETCYSIASNRFAVLYEEGEGYSLNQLSGVKIIPRCFGLMSSAPVLETTGVSQVQRQQGLNLYGQGIMVGFIDTGIDYSHPAFIADNGESRIVSIWDQTIEEEGEVGNVPEGFYYGVEYTKEDINLALQSDNPMDIVPSRDTNGHGTFQAGVACGNIIAEKEFAGIAPFASICMVKCKEAKQNLRDYYHIDTKEPCYSESDIMLAVRYLWLQAVKQRMPLVICLGMGTNQGGHSSGGILGGLLQEYGDYRGVFVVTGGGNEGNASHHFQSEPINVGDEVEVEVRVGEREYGFTLELWSDATDLFSVGLISPDGEYSGKTVARLGEKREVRFLFEGTVVTIEYLINSYENGDQCVRMRFRNPSAGIWRIRVFNDSNFANRFNMWLPMNAFLSAETYFVTANPDITLCDPGNNTGVITTAFYDSYNGGIVAESGRGYTRTGNIKPDFSAPGVQIFGPLNYPGNYPTTETQRIESARYRFESGSSKAAAVTAGAVALLAEWAFILENDIGMDTSKAKKYLIRGADRENLTIPSRIWGNGKLDLFGVFDSLRPVAR